MRTEGSHKAVAFSAIVFMLFGGYFAYAAYLTGQPSTMPFVQSIAAKDGESGGGDSDNEDEDKDEDKDEDRDGSSGKNRSGSSDDDEDENDDDDRVNGVKLRGDGSVDDDQNDDDDIVNGVKLRGDGSVDDDQSGKEDEDELDDDRSNREEREAMFKDRTKTLEKLSKKIAEAEKKILEKQAEGVDVSAALAQLALAKAGLSSVDAAFTANELDRIKALVKATEKLTHFARGKTLHDSEDVAKDVAKVAKRIAQTKEKIARLASLGGDTTAYVASLKDAEADYAAAQAQIAAGGESLLAGLSALEVVERRVKSIKHSIEGALFALGSSDDDEFENEHGVEVGDDSDELSELADADEDHTALRALARTHKRESTKVSSLLKDLDDRSAFARALFGLDQDVLDALKTDAVVNADRIAAMQRAADEVEDNELNLLINEKIGELKAENAKLISFISAKNGNSGLFGWLSRLF
jgi:cytochrome c556